MADVAALDEFATLLRGMKERSGRTYEALARRAGISSSALHRYCSGRSVPPGFDVVERLGRVCGASREELLELHRRWAVAAAAREGSLQAGAGLESGQVADLPAVPTDRPEPDVTAGREGAPHPVAEAPLGRSRRAGRPRLLPVVGAGVVAVGLVLTGWLLAGRADRGLHAAAPAKNPYSGRLLFSPACAASIYMGEDDECVRELQTLLTKAGTTMAIDAAFGPETLRKTTAFQVLAGLTANGVVDDATKRALYAGKVRMTSWTPAQVERRIRQVFPEEPERALRIARCQSFLDPFYVLPNVNGTRNWGLFQIADFLLRRYDGTPKQAFDPEWNIQTARRVWAEHHDFDNWPHCDPKLTASPSAGPGQSR